MKEMWEFIKSYGKMILFFGIIIVATVLGLSMQYGRNEENSRKILEDALHRATVQCYALESRYPPDLEYLEENYGVNIDKDKYSVFYEGIASNIMPDITVITLDGEGD